MSTDDDGAADDETDARPRGGRPRSDAKRDAVLAAARRLFLEHAFDRVSMDAVAQAAGVSKVTVYAHFKSKEDLFAAAISAGMEPLFGRVALEAVDGADLERSLAAFGAGFVLMITAPDVFALHAVMMAEGVRNPELPRRFYELVVDKGTRDLAAALADAAARGLIACEDPYLAAVHFIALCQGQFSYRQQLGMPRGEEAEIHAYAAGVARLFLSAYSTRNAPQPAGDAR